MRTLKVTNTTTYNKYVTISLVIAAVGIIGEFYFRRHNSTVWSLISSLVAASGFGFMTATNVSYGKNK